MAPAASAALAMGVLKTMTGLKWKLAASAVLSLMVAAGGAGVLAGGQGDEPDRGKTPERVGTVAPAVLERLVKLDCRDRPLNDALKSLLDGTGLRIVYEGEATKRAAQSKINVEFDQVKLGSALRLLFGYVRLAYRIEGDLLVLSGPSDLRAESDRQNRPSGDDVHAGWAQVAPAPGAPRVLQGHAARLRR
jgi:hypothetical protein